MVLTDIFTGCLNYVSPSAVFIKRVIPLIIMVPKEPSKEQPHRGCTAVAVSCYGAMFFFLAGTGALTKIDKTVQKITLCD